MPAAITQCCASRRHSASEAPATSAHHIDTSAIGNAPADRPATEKPRLRRSVSLDKHEGHQVTIGVVRRDVRVAADQAEKSAMPMR